MAARAGFTPRTVSLHYPVTFRAIKDGYEITEIEAGGIDELVAACNDLWQQMLGWMGNPNGQFRPVFDGSLRALADCYQRDLKSPYHKLAPNTRRGYDGWITTLIRKFGERRVDKIDGIDLGDMFNEVLQPSEPGGAPRIRLARAVVAQMLPILLTYGALINLGGCIELLKLYDLVEFRVSRETRQAWKASRPKKMPMEFEHAAAIVARGIAKCERRWLSVALGVAAQFEFMLSQIDVIGSWEKIAPRSDIAPGSIVRGGKIWRPGLIFEDFASGEIANIARSKTGVDLPPFKVDEYPLVVQALAAVPESKRRGALVTNDNGDPMKTRYYAELYRDLADEVGVPKEVWNMRARHGGITEAREAGADRDDTKNHAGHTTYATTDKHYALPTREGALRVQRKRVAKRKKIA